MIFAIDKNLELAIDTPEWKQFFHKFHITPKLYTDMKQLTLDMEKNNILLSYLPTANYFYFRKDPAYIPIANALFSANQKSTMSSVLVVAKNSPFNTLSDLKEKRYGYIHCYCTSSYFSIALLLWRNHFSIHSFFSSMQQVEAWQPQIDAVVAGKVDATMVPETVWEKVAENKKTTKIIATQENLPSPLILCKKDANKELVKELKELLFAFQDPHAPLFNGFIPYQKELTEAFFSEAELAYSGR